MEVKSLEPNVQSFQANGKEYKMQTLTIGRLRAFRKLAVHFAWGMSLEVQRKELQDAEKCMNKQDWVSAAVHIRTLGDRLKYYQEERDEPALLLCTLFFNTPDEDITKWDEVLAHQKIEDWNQEGLDFKDFFTLAGTLVPGLIETLNETSLNILRGTAVVD